MKYNKVVCIVVLFCCLVGFSSCSNLDSVPKTPVLASLHTSVDTLIVAPDSLVLAQTGAPTRVVADTVTSESEKGIHFPGKKTIEKLNPVGEIRNVVSLGKIIKTLIFLGFTFLVLLIVTRVLNALSEYSTNYRILFKRTIPIVRISVWTISIYVIVAGIFSPPYETVIAFFASVGVAIGFAAQDVLKNIFGGLVILFDRPFQVGDKIDMGGHYGEVIEIGLRSVRVVTAGDSVVTIPNAEIMNNSVSNSNTGETNCLVETEIYLPLDTDITVARAVATEAAHVAKHIYLKKPISILFFNEFKDRQSLLRMVIKAYVSDPRNELALKSEITELVVPELLNRKVTGFNL